MTPNRAHQKNGPVCSWHCVKIYTPRHLCEKPDSHDASTKELTLSVFADDVEVVSFPSEGFRGVRGDLCHLLPELVYEDRPVRQVAPV